MQESSLSESLATVVQSDTPLCRNGRDVHRELCGFIFLEDSSLTVYEFRQFGQRSSALPLVPRAVYCHPKGKRKGHKYEICHIHKVVLLALVSVKFHFCLQGATLYFETGQLVSLPESLCQKPLLAIRITGVDEKMKHNLM